MSDIRVFILCAGDCTRWNNFLGIPKQLALIGGESLLSRSIKLLKAYNINEIFIISKNDLMRIDNCSFLEPEKHRYTCETLLSTNPLWSERNIILLGDVFFSRKAIRKIVISKKQLCIFGRSKQSAYTMCRHGEIFAMSFNSSMREVVIRALKRTIELATNNVATGNLWNLYDTLEGFPLYSKKINKRSFKQVNDITDDIDTPEEYYKLTKLVNALSGRNVLKIILIHLKAQYVSLVLFLHKKDANKN